MSFYDETLKARHEDDMDDDYGEIGGAIGAAEAHATISAGAVCAVGNRSRVGSRLMA